jgi:hypothetical protein
VAAILLAAACCTWLALPAGATGILPPANPPANIAPASADFLASINAARAAEGVGPMDVSESKVASLPIPEQVFVLVNLERIDRGLRPISFMTTQLTADSQRAVDAGIDPSLPAHLSGGSPVTWSGAIWAGDLNSVFEADYYWMYSDGWGGSTGATTNAVCSPLSPSRCWGHRDVILHQFGDCGTASPTLSMGAASSWNATGGESISAVLVGTCAAPSDVTLTWHEALASVLGPPRVIGLATLPSGQGYWEAESDGGVGAFGNAVHYGSMAGQSLNSPIVGMAATPDGKGYWLVAADGGVFNFGDAGFYGSTGVLHLAAPIVGMAATPDGKGYWLVASDGGIFSFGDAPFRGSMGGRHINTLVVGMAADPATGGYWLVAADGGIFTFGAPFLGSTGSEHLAQPIVGMDALPDGDGYRLESADGGVFCFGQAGFAGSLSGHPLAAPVVGLAADQATGGYWLVAADGGVFGFGDAPYFGRITT